MQGFKRAVKHSLSNVNIFGTIELLRQIPAIIRWLKFGARGIAPSAIKRTVLLGYIKSYNLKKFVETGTHLGDTLAIIAGDKSVAAVSIELDEYHYQSAVLRFDSWENVTLLRGDSGELMEQIVRQTTEPTLFWLDGHFSGGSTAKGELDTPVSAELRAIMHSKVNGHVILIDDVRQFDGTHDYPHLEDLLSLIRSDGRYNAEISTDILRLTPIKSDVKL